MTWDNQFDPYDQLLRLRADCEQLHKNDLQIAQAHNRSQQDLAQLAEQVRNIATIQTQLMIKLTECIEAVRALERKSQ